MSHLKYGLDHVGSRRMTPGSARAFAQIPLALLLASPAFYAQAELYLSGFEKGQELPPGTYRADIYLNDGYMTTRDVTFNAGEKGHGLAPCLTRGQLAGMGVNTSAIAGIDVLAADACVPLTEMIKDATTRFDAGQQRLYLTIPQAFMGNRARGYIPPELWDHGINAGL
ncbi:MAG: FimD/PapC N-terminal domain-containing protein, partial [Klebsiella michiganensis]|nr:FimD/PapC N-terminal domain-containing protein [Klebsiella michiganensis]